jgi:hypothetical protein
MSEANRDIQVFKFQSIYEEPVWQTRRGKDWVEFGKDNLAFDYIDRLTEQSADHAAILSGLISFVIGEGLVEPTEAKALAFYTNGSDNVSNPSNLNEIMKKLVADLAVTGGALLNVRWRKDRQGIADLHYVDVRTMRPDVAGDGYWISSNWKEHRREPNVPVFWPKFNAGLKERGGSQLLYIRIPAARITPLALPSWWSIREYVECDQELINFHLSRLRNSFHPSTIIMMSDPSVTPEEQDKNYNNLKEFYGGSMNAGKAAILYGKDVSFERFEPSVVPEDFELLQANVDRKIRRGHKVTGRGDIFGLNAGDGTTFSSNDDLLNEFEAYSRLVVKGYQNLLTNAFKMLSSCNGINHEWEIEPFILFPEVKEKVAAPTKAPVSGQTEQGQEKTIDDQIPNAA